MIILVFLSMFSFVSCENEDEKLTTYKTIDELNGKPVSVLIGSASESRILERLPDSKYVYNDSSAVLLLDLINGNTVASPLDYPAALLVCAKNKQLTLIQEPITTCDYAFPINKDHPEIKEKVDYAINILKKSGELDHLYDIWIKNPQDDAVVEFKDFGNKNGVLKVGTDPQLDGVSFIKNNELAGFEMAVVARIGEILEMDVEVTRNKFSSLFADLETNKIDFIAACCSVTEKRKETFLFSDPVHAGGVYFVVINRDYVSDNRTFFEKVSDRINTTLIQDGRYKMIISGLKITLMLTIGASVFGSIFGYFLSFVLRSKNKAISRTSNYISNLVNRLPVVVILMIFYYLVFGDSKFPAVVIAIVGLSVYFANQVAITINTGVKAVGIGQIEAAEALGYKQGKIFRKIVFPQAVSQMYGHYVKSICTLCLETSIVGYVTIEDLTRVSDIIRGRTFDALIPLLLSSVCYFALTTLIILVLNLLGNVVDPYKKKRKYIGGENKK